MNSVEELNTILQWGELIHKDADYICNFKFNIEDIKNNLQLYYRRRIYVKVFDEKYRNIGLEDGYSLIYSEINYLRTIIKKYGLCCYPYSFNNKKLVDFITLINNTYTYPEDEKRIKS